jgi:Uma2 family endonuclease
MARRMSRFYGVDMDANVAPVAEPKRKATYDDVLAAPEHQVAEILDGELFLSPRPASPHARATSALGSRIFAAYDGEGGEPTSPGGWWILDEPELHLGPDVVVPDIAGWRRERMPRIPDAPWLDLAPDWVCETLSPSTARIDRTRKLRIYAREAVRHVWLVDPLARTLEVLALDGERWVVAENHGGDDVVRAAPFAAIELALAHLWLD